MIIKSFLTQRHEFRVAKKVEKTQRAELIAGYRKYFELCLILSLLITLVLFQLYPGTKKQVTSNEEFELSLEVIDIPITRQEEPPPPPPPTVQEVIKNYTVIVKNEKKDIHKLRQNLEKVTLELDPKDDNTLLANSQIDDITYASLVRNRARFQSGVSLNINTELNRLKSQNGGGLDFDLGTTATTKRFVDNAVDLKGPALPKITASPKKASKKATNELITINKNQFLLKESESTIGTNEYRLWNKINAVLDRLDKNRFGKLPENVRRTRNGLMVAFKYRSGVIHEIFWAKGGKVIIRVTGQRPKNLVSELQRAFDSLIQLTL